MGAKSSVVLCPPVNPGKATVRRREKGRAMAFRWPKGKSMPQVLRERGPLPPCVTRCDIPPGCCFFTEPWTVTCSSLRMLRRVAAFCRLLRPVLLLVSFPRSRKPPPPHAVLLGTDSSAWTGTARQRTVMQSKSQRALQWHGIGAFHCRGQANEADRAQIHDNEIL